jgi:hypothetical protein
MRHRRVLVIVLSLLPTLLAAALWARSYRRRDLLAWDSGRAESRRLTCQVYSSWGRVCLLSYSRPDAAEPAPRRNLSLQSGDRTTTEPLSETARNQLQQAGVMGPGPLGFAYAQHVGSMSSGTHVWTAAVLPWWCVSIVAFALPVYLSVRALRPRPAQPEDGMQNAEC